MNITPYDDRALQEIRAWKNPELGWFGHAMRVINWPLDRTGDLILATPGLGDAIKLSIQGLTGVCNDVAQWSVQKDAIYAEFRKAGYAGINKEADVFDIKLEDIDKMLGWLAAKYKGIALAEGAGAGAAGLPGIPSDLIALIALNLRAIGEYATYYGFDVHSREERLFAMNVLGLASSPNDTSKSLAMSQLIRIARDVAKKRSRAQLENQAFLQVVQRIARALGIRLTKVKLGQLVPAAGVAVGGGFNAYFTAKVCDASYYLYRERFLAQKYGADVIAVTVCQAEEIDPRYPEEDEGIPG